MKIAICIIVASLSFWGCSTSTGSDKKEQGKGDAAPKAEQSKSGTKASELFSLADAEKILGERAHIKDTSTSMSGSVLTYQCAYEADAKDLKKGKTGVIYFMFEEYAHDSSAKRVYAFIKKGNENHGIKVLNDFGDEAYFHTDSTNFYFILARKGTKMYRIKVNKITSTTSLDAFNSISKRITTEM